MEITHTQTPMQLVESSVRRASGFGMPASGQQSCSGVLADSRIASNHATGFIAVGSDLRDRTDLVAKGHVAFAAYVPGYPAWSPPSC